MYLDVFTIHVFLKLCRRVETQITNVLTVKSPASASIEHLVSMQCQCPEYPTPDTTHIGAVMRLMTFVSIGQLGKYNNNYANKMGQGNAGDLARELFAIKT